MRIARKPWLLVAVGVLLATAALLACQAIVRSTGSSSKASPYLNGAPVLQREGDAVVVSSTVVTHDVSKRLAELLAQPGVVELRLGYIPGGVATPELFKGPHLRQVDVVVTGPCASFCAFIALGGRSIRFQSDAKQKTRPFLLFHGVVQKRSVDSDQVEYRPDISSEVANIVRRRFPLLPQEDVDEAMSLVGAEASGLVVELRHNNYYVFSLCKPWPDKCREIWRVQAERL